MKKVLAALLISALSVSLTGCGLFETFQGQSDDKPNAYSNVYELSSGMAYVWDHKGESDIRKDLSQDRVGDAVFFACPKGPAFSPKFSWAICRSRLPGLFLL